MSFLLESLRDKPVALYMMDDTSPFQDYSGYARSATSSGGTPPKHISLVKGALFSQVFGNSITGTFEAPVFNKNYESQAFSLEAWVRVVSPNDVEADQQVLGNSGAMDGLVVTGTRVSFVTKYETAPDAIASHDLQVERAVHLVGVHSEDKNSLYVDGELVSEVSLTEEQQGSLYLSTSTNLFSGTTASTQLIAVNALGVYGYALTSEIVSRHFEVGRDLAQSEEVSAMFGADKIIVTRDFAQAFLDQTWDSDEDWNSGEIRNVMVTSNKVTPQEQYGVSINGSWLDSFALDSASSTSIYNVSMDWDGEGVVVEASLDGLTWEVATRGRALSIIPSGFNPTGKELQVRATFSGGIVNDPAYLNSLNVFGISSASFSSDIGRVVTLTSANPQYEKSPLELNENWGMEIEVGGSVVISADTSEDASPVRTLELWVKKTGTTEPTYSVSGTSYINGATGSVMPDDQWVLRHIVATADIAGSVTINGPAQIGHIALYDRALTATEISEIHQTYVGTKVLRASDNSVLTVTEPATSVDIYAHDWAIQSSG